MPAAIKLFGIFLVAISVAGQELSEGSILVANEKLSDPNFSRTVVLIVKFDEGNGAEGMVLNRQTEITISKLFPKSKRTANDPVYQGGPVEVTGAQALIRLTASADNAAHVMGDVYLTGNKDLIDKSINSETEASKFRLYLGYAGWGPGQLEAEIRLGAWTVMTGNSKIVFDPHPDSLWLRLNHDSRMRIASVMNEFPVFQPGRLAQ